MQRDNLYAKSQAIVDAFQFDAQVASVFDDMIKRSVPGYTMMLEMLGVVANKYAQDNSNCYDIGCSLGASTLAIAQNTQANNCNIIAIDNSQAMIDQCHKVIAATSLTPSIELLCQSAQTIEFSNISLCSMNLTLQFIAVDERHTLLSNIANNMLDGGVLFLSEKIRFDDELTQTQLTDLHHQFKKHQGYSDLEIAQKRSAIDNVLIPETLSEHKERLLKAGFSKVTLALQAFNFVTLLAYK